MSADISLAHQQMFEEVVDGLRRPQKMLPSKYFYDKKGSELFEQITHLDEYYPTRTEKKILKDNIDEIAALIGKNSVIIELGSGSSKKTRMLLDHIPDVSAYVPVDISEEYLQKVVQNLRQEYPGILIKPVCADYTSHFEIPLIEVPFKYYVVFFPGSTIGNFRPEQARDFLSTISGFMVPGGGLLIGVDLKKDTKILEDAYNDAKGITAAFNKNILAHLNRELNADFQVDQFMHKACYNEEKGRIEMYLVSKKEQQVHLSGEQILLREGESIHTENSYKYSLEDFEELVSDWFNVEKVWTDEGNLFSLQYLVKK